MSLFTRLFRKRNAEDDNPPIRFGRYTDSYKLPEQYEYWEQSLKAFEREEYMASYLTFFKYLQDEGEGNVQFQETENGIEFVLYQGSNKVTGIADLQHFKAEAKVARTEAMNIGFLRRLIDQNYDLKYARFALDPNDDIAIVFDTYSLDASPYKVYYGLKELATNADKQDDLLLDEFTSLHSLETEHLRDLPLAEKEVKYQYIQAEIQKVFAQLDSGKPDPLQYPGAGPYLLLNLCYKLDFLTKPEGRMMEMLERIHRLFFAKDDRNTLQKSNLLRKEFQKLLDRPKDEFFKEMYQAPATFGITTPVTHDKLVTFIDGELGNMDWYAQNGHHDIAMAVPGYIAGFCLFNYALPKPDWDLLLLYFQVTESEYFRQLGFKPVLYDTTTGEFDKKAIIREIREIAEEHEDAYPKMHPPTGMLDFSSQTAFARSFLLMMRNTTVVKAERNE